MGEHLNREEYKDALRLGTLYSILDQALVTDPIVGEIARRAAIKNSRTDDWHYVWERYGIDLSIVRSWIEDRKLFNSVWQCCAAEKSEELMSKW